MADHYDAASGEFGERRKTVDQTTAIGQLSKDFKLFQESTKEDLADFGKTLQWYMEHSDALQRQTQDSLQRQLDQNNEQHKDMMTMFKGDLEKLVDLAENKMDMIQKLQATEDKEQDRRIDCLETDITTIKCDVKTIKDSKVQGKAGKWDKLQGAVAAAIVAVLLGAGTYSWNQAAAAAGKQVQAVTSATLPKGKDK